MLGAGAATATLAMASASIAMNRQRYAFIGPVSFHLQHEMFMVWFAEGLP
jgi:hypothetical protein